MQNYTLYLKDGNKVTANGKNIKVALDAANVNPSNLSTFDEGDVTTTHNWNPKKNRWELVMPTKIENVKSILDSKINEVERDLRKAKIGSIYKENLNYFQVELLTLRDEILNALKEN